MILKINKYVNMTRFPKKNATFEKDKDDKNVKHGNKRKYFIDLLFLEFSITLKKTVINRGKKTKLNE